MLLISVILPTLFFWAVDTFALQQGTWVIQGGTKLDWQIWGELDIEYVTRSSLERLC